MMQRISELVNTAVKTIDWILLVLLLKYSMYHGNFIRTYRFFLLFPIQ